MNRSGTEEEYDERSQLLQDVVERMDDAAASKKKSGKQSKAGSDEKAVEIRDAAMQSREKKVKGIEFCYHQSMHDVYM